MNTSAQLQRPSEWRARFHPSSFQKVNLARRWLVGRARRARRSEVKGQRAAGSATPPYKSKTPCHGSCFALFLICLGLAPTAIAQQLVLPDRGAYTGAYMDWGETEDGVTYEKLLKFEKLAGKHQAIVAFSSYWGTGAFPTAQVAAVEKYGAAPLIYWSPWGPPYEQGVPQPSYALSEILGGKFDAYIQRWATQAAKARIPLLVAWGLEMNGDWFPWCGPCQGAGSKATFGNNSKEDGPEKYIAAYRHIVDLVRKTGAHNIQWVFHANNFSYPEEKWNRMADYYPGDDYVDWLGLSVYGMQFPNRKWHLFNDVLKDPYREITKLHASKPVILAEWGVGEFPQQGSKPAFFTEAFESLKTSYPRIKAAVYWHERWQNHNELYSNLRINSSPNSLEAYRRGIRDPFWISQPTYK